MITLSTIKELSKEIFFIIIGDKFITILSIILCLVLMDAIYYIEELSLNNFLTIIKWALLLPILMMLNLHFKK